MDDRIEIPTSEPDSSPVPGSWYRRWTLPISVLAFLSVLGFSLGGAGGDGSDPIEGEGEIAPPPTVEGDGTRPALNSSSFPGAGTVTAILELDGELVAVAAGDHWGSSIWRLEDTSETWQVTDGVAGITIVDAVPHPQGLVAVGFGTFDRSPVLLVGPMTDLRPFPLDVELGEVPYEIDVVSGSVFVSVRFQDGSTGAPSNIYLIEDGARAQSVGAGRDRVVVEDIFAHEGDVLAVGSEAGRPSMWRVGVVGDLMAIDVDFGIDSGRIAAAGHISARDRRVRHGTRVDVGVSIGTAVLRARRADPRHVGSARVPGRRGARSPGSIPGLARRGADHVSNRLRSLVGRRSDPLRPSRGKRSRRTNHADRRRRHS